MNLHRNTLTLLFTVSFAAAISGVFSTASAQTTAAANLSPSPNANVSATNASVPDQSPVDVNIFIRVPHNLKARDEFTAFPYPVKPPPISIPIKPLSIKRKNIEHDLLQSGYADRISDSTTWAGYGWRWRYAVAAAEKKSGLGYPHTMIDMYSWTHEMAPYVYPIILRINAVEEERTKRYDKATEFYENNSSDLENDATRNGLSSIILHIVQDQAHVKLAPGNWWITGRHHVTGLIYYWQAPITVKAGQPVNLNLTEWNALLIQGAW